jgi:hypothetical protein
LKLLQERVEDILDLPGTDNNFLSSTQMAQQPRERIDKLDYIKLKMLLHDKRNGHKIEEVAPRMGEIFC